MNRDELADLRQKYAINPAFFRRYGHLFTKEGLVAISQLDCSQMTKLNILFYEDLFPPITMEMKQ